MTKEDEKIEKSTRWKQNKALNEKEKQRNKIRTKKGEIKIKSNTNKEKKQKLTKKKRNKKNKRNGGRTKLENNKNILTKVEKYEV